MGLILIAHAQTLDAFIAKFYTAIFNPFILLFMSIGAVVFLWGVIQFIAGGNDEERVTTGKRHMLYGIIGLAIMVSVWGILNVICSTIGACP